MPVLGGAVEHESEADELIRTSLQITRAQQAWLEARKRRLGVRSVSTMIRMLVQETMNAEASCQDKAS